MPHPNHHPQVHDEKVDEQIARQRAPEKDANVRIRDGVEQLRADEHRRYMQESQQVKAMDFYEHLAWLAENGTEDEQEHAKAVLAALEAKQGE